MQSYGSGFTTVFSSFTHEETSVEILPPNQGRSGKNDGIARDKCLIISSTAAAVAIIFIILLIITLLLLRRYIFYPLLYALYD